MKSLCLLVFMAVVMMGCGSKKLDLSTVDFSKSADTYLNGIHPTANTAQKGHYEIEGSGDHVNLALKDQGERIEKYTFMDETAVKQLNYGGIPINPVLGAAICVYNGKIGFMRLQAAQGRSLDLFLVLKKQLGAPTEVITDSVRFEDGNVAQKEFLESLPAYSKKIKDDMDDVYLHYPQNIIWIKGDLIYQLTLSPVEKNINNTLVVITRKAFKDKVIFGYHVPDQDPILSKYMK